MGIVDLIYEKVPCLLSRRTSFLAMTLLLGVFFVVEIVVGYITNSMALIADSFHMLSDVASLIVGYLALKYSSVDAPKERYTYGYARAEVLGALVNAVFLVALCFSIFIEAMKRLIILEPIENPLLVLVVGAIGLLVNVFGLFLFHQAGYEAHGHSHGGLGHGHSHGGGHGHSHGGHSHSHGGLPPKKPAPITPPERTKLSDSAHETKKPESVDSEEKATETEVNENAGTDLEKADRNLSMESEDKSKSDESKHLLDPPSFDSSAPESLDALERQKIPRVKSAGQLNITGVYLHILGDALGSVIVMISALIIMFAEGTWTLYVDPAMSIIMVAIILKTSIPLLSETSRILMNSVPRHIHVKDLEKRLKDTIAGVRDVHELHVWQLAGDKVIASAHVKFAPSDDNNAAASEIKEFFHANGIHSTTIQLEFERDEDNPLNISRCMLLCSLEDGCDDMMCCKPLR